jgi:hypothetical protein
MDVDEPREAVFDLMADVGNMRWTFDYSSAGPSTTHVDAHAEIQPKGPMRAIGRLMGPMIRRTFSKRPAQLTAGLQRTRSAA